MQARGKIMLCDDDPDLLDLYREFLSRRLPSRPEIQTAIGGLQALAMLEAERFDLLICNLKIPGMNGLEVLATVRSNYPQVRTMILTDGACEEIRARVYALGVDLLCEKPATDQETKTWLAKVGALQGRQFSPVRDVVQSEP